MAQTPEGVVKTAIKKLLQQRGVWFYMPVQNGMGVVGIPDFICCWDQKFLAIEAKAPGKRNNTTPNQKARLAEIQAANGLALVVDDIEQLKEVLGDAVERPRSQTCAEKGILRG